LVNRLFFLHSSSQTKTKVQHGPLTRVNGLAFRLSLSSLAHMQLSKTDSKSRLVWWSWFSSSGGPVVQVRAPVRCSPSAPLLRCPLRPPLIIQFMGPVRCSPSARCSDAP
jgi:hypothetical protein